MCTKSRQPVVYQANVTENDETQKALPQMQQLRL